MIDNITNYLRSTSIGNTIAYGCFFFILMLLSIWYYNLVRFIISRYVYNEVYEVGSIIGTFGVVVIAYIIYMVGTIEMVIRFSRFMNL